MQNPESLTDKVKRLPDADQREVAGFVDFLLSRTPGGPDSARVLDETAGIWKGEITGTVYEDAIRAQWNERRKWIG